LAKIVGSLRLSICPQFIQDLQEAIWIKDLKKHREIATKTPKKPSLLAREVETMDRKIALKV
jgi:hypothetical protein